MVRRWLHSNPPHADARALLYPPPDALLCPTLEYEGLSVKCSPSAQGQSGGARNADSGKQDLLDAGARWTRATCASRIVYIGALLRTLALPTPRPKQPLSSRSPLCVLFCAGTMRLLAAVGAAISSARPPPTTRDPRARPCRAMWRASRPLPWCVGRGMRRAPFGPRASAESAWRMVSRQHGPLCAGACRSCVRSIALAPGASRRVLLDGPRRTACPPCACLSSRRCYACSCVTTELVPRSGRNDCIRYCIDSDMIAYVE